MSGFLEHLAGLYTAPSAAFEAILARGGFVKPLVLLVVLNVAFTAIWFSRVDTAGFFEAQNAQSKGWAELSAEQRAQTSAVQARMMKPIVSTFAVIGAPLLVLAVGSFYLFVFRFFLATELKFRQSLTIVAWSFLPVALVSTPLTLLVLFLKGDWTLDPARALQASLAAVVDPDTAPRALYALAGSLDLFVFWILLLLSTGYRIASPARQGGVLAAVLVPWVLYVLGKAALAALF